MIKKIAIICLLTLIGSTLSAKSLSNNNAFIGLEVGYSQVQGTVVLGASREDSEVSYGFHLGAQEEDWRTTFIFNYYDNSASDQNVEELLLVVDYFLLDSKDLYMKPYIGVNLGYANYESFLVEDSDMVYGMQVGFVIDLKENINIDLSYRYSLSNSDVFDHKGNVILGLNYLY